MWKDHIKKTEKTNYQNFGLLYHAKLFLDETSLKRIYFLNICSYLNYADITWANVLIAKSKPLLYKHKQVLRIVFNESP